MREFLNADFAPFDFAHQKQQARLRRLDREVMARGFARRASDGAQQVTIDETGISIEHVQLPDFADTMPAAHGFEDTVIEGDVTTIPDESIEVEAPCDRAATELFEFAEYVVARTAFLYLVATHGYFPPQEPAIHPSVAKLYASHERGRLLGVA